MIRLHVSPSVNELLSATDGFVEVLAGIEEVVTLKTPLETNSTLLTFEGEEIQISGLVTAVDSEAQKARLTKLVDEKRNQISGFQNRLSNPGYLKNAKPEIITETRKMLAQAEADLKAAESSLKNLD